MDLQKFKKIDKSLETLIRETASSVALSTEGVSSLPQKAISVERNGNGLDLNVSVIVEYGRRIPEVAWDTQENVKKAVSAVSDINIKKVNVNIQGVE